MYQASDQQFFVANPRLFGTELVRGALPTAVSCHGLYTYGQNSQNGYGLYTYGQNSQNSYGLYSYGALPTAVSCHMPVHMPHTCVQTCVDIWTRRFTGPHCLLQHGDILIFPFITLRVTMQRDCAHVYTHVYRHVYRHVYAHMQRDYTITCLRPSIVSTRIYVSTRLSMACPSLSCLRLL